ncbi:hypothetical protein ACFX2I_004512 [Malus domestica]
MAKTPKSISLSVLFVLFIVFAVADSELIGCRDWSYSSTWQGSCLWSPNCNKACTEREGATAGACLLFKCVCYDGKGCPQGHLPQH